MAKSSISQTEDLTVLLQVLQQEIPAYLEPTKASKTHPPSLKCNGTNGQSSGDVAGSDVVTSKQNIIHACEKIVALLQGPTVKLTLDASGHLTSTAISIALRLRLPHLISSDATKPTTLEELSETTSASSDLIARVLRYLTQRFIFEEVAPGCYVQNTMSKALTIPVAEAWIDLIATEYHRGSASLFDLLSEHNLQIPPDEKPTALTKSLQSTGFPYAQLPAGSRVVDVGGGSGHITAPLARQYPHLHFVVQDSADTIRYGQSLYGGAKAETEAEAQAQAQAQALPITWQTVDFFREQPVQGARVYLLRHILIDHPDRTARQILGCIAQAMDADSRLLIADAIVPARFGEESDSLINALDLHLLCLFNSKERSLPQWEALLGSVGKGLEIVKVWRTDDAIGQEAMLEVRLKE